MDVDIKRYIQVGIIHHMVYEDVFSNEVWFEKSFKTLLEDPFFDVIETAESPFVSMPGKIRSWVGQAHMQVAYGGQSRTLSRKLNINALDKRERNKALETLRQGIDEAAEMGAFGFSFLSGHYENDHIDEAMDVLVDSCSILCEYAKQYRLPLCLEAFDHEIDKKAFIGPASRAKTLCQRVCSVDPYFGLLVDCSHIPMIGETLDENLDPVVGFVKHAHMGNTVIKDRTNPSFGDTHPRFGFPGSENDTEYLSRFLKKLIEIGYLEKDNPRPVSFEVRPQMGEESSLVLANAKRTLSRAWLIV